MDGLHPVQLELVSAIPDGQDILCCTATGNGKSAAFAVPALVLLKYNAHPDAYPAGLPTRKRPIGVVITPTRNWPTISYISYLFLMLCAHRFLGFRTVKTERLRRFLVLRRPRAFTRQRVEGNHRNTQFTIQFITGGLDGEKFPDLLPYLATRRKTIILSNT